LLLEIKQRSGRKIIETESDWLRPAPEVVVGGVEAAYANSKELLFGPLIDSPPRFFEGINLPTREMEDWADRVHARLLAQRQTQLEREIRKAESMGNWKAVHELCRDLLILDQEDEELLVLAARALALDGLPEEALRLVRQQLQASEPASGLAEKLAAVLTELDDLSQLVLSASPAPALVGREDELQTVMDRIRSTERTCVSVVFLAGHAGVGKSRLLRELVPHLHVAGFGMARAACSEFESSIPLSPLIDLCTDGLIGGFVETLEEPWRQVIQAALPYAKAEDPPYIRPNESPRRLCEAFLRLFEAATADRPLVLVLDDLQWCDETSLSVLAFLVRRWESGHLVLLAGVRSPLSELARSARAFLDHFADSESLLELTEISRENAEELVTCVNNTMDHEEVAEVCELGGGNPLFLIELAQNHGRSAGKGLSDNALAPTTIGQVIGRGLAELGSAEQRILSIASVVARPMRLLELADLAGLKTIEAAFALDRLLQLRILQLDDGMVSLVHELVRREVYLGLGESGQRLLHVEVGEHLLANGTGPHESAIHFHLAGRSDMALQCALQAAASAEASGAVAEAIRFLEMARSNTGDEQLDTELVGRLATIHYQHRNVRSAIPLLELATRRFEAGDRWEESLLAKTRRIDLLRREGAWSIDDLRNEIATVKSQAEERGLWDSVAHALDVEVMTLEQAAMPGEMASPFREAVDCLDRCSTEGRCRALCILTYQILFGDPRAGLEAARAAASLARDQALGDLGFMAHVRLVAALITHGLLESDEGQATLAFAREMANSSGDLHHRFLLELDTGVWALDTANYDRARRQFAKAASVIRRAEATHESIMLTLNLGELELLEGNWEEAHLHFTSAESLIAANSSEYVWITEAGLGLCALNLGQIAEANRRRERLPPLPSDWNQDPTIVGMFLSALLRLNQRHEASADLLAELARAVKHRFVVHSLRLRLEECRIRRRFDEDQSRQVAELALAESEELKLSMLASLFRAHVVPG
ncbi:MAG: ATP-binding protein, partial [Planctomycetota bacterium]|jgi:tetratricopeptide (TPR) repeat protein